MGLIKFGPYAKMKHLTTTRFRNSDPRLEKSTFPCSQNVLKEGFSKIASRLGYNKSQKCFCADNNMHAKQAPIYWW